MRRQLMMMLMVAATVGCRETVRNATPGVPPQSGCVPATERCGAHSGGETPEFCARDGRWWPSMPRSEQGVQRVCAHGCEMVGVHAECVSPMDGGVR